MDNTGIAYQAVANFLATVDREQPLQVHIMNVHHDCWLYGWSWQTVAAMLHGLNEMYQEISHG